MHSTVLYLNVVTRSHKSIYGFGFWGSRLAFDQRLKSMKLQNTSNEHDTTLPVMPCKCSAQLRTCHPNALRNWGHAIQMPSATDDTSSRTLRNWGHIIQMLCATEDTSSRPCATEDTSSKCSAQLRTCHQMLCATEDTSSTIMFHVNTSWTVDVIAVFCC